MADAINGDEHSEIHSVGGRNPVTLQDFAEKYAVPHTFTDYDTLINDPAVDIVYIALPNHLHHHYIEKAAAAGKAILCEKSLSVDMEKSKQALVAVNQHQVFFTEGLMYLCHPLIEKALELLASGVIGEVKAIQGSYVAAISQFVNAESKGALYNLGCYPMSLAHLILQQALPAGQGMDYQLSAMGRIGNDGNICESSATWRFANKISVQLHTAEDYGLKHSFTVLGSKGSLTFTSNPWLPLKTNELEVEIYEASKETITVEALGDAFYYQVRAIHNTIEAGDKSLTFPKATLQISEDVMALLTDWEAATRLID
jgi:predicted dehydrogenase